MAHVYRFQSLHDSALKILATPQPGVWIDVVGMDASDVAALSVAHGLDDGHLVDAQDFYETPRFEQEGDATYFFTRYPAIVDGEHTTAPILITIGSDYLLTAVHTRPEWLDRCVADKEVFTTQKTKFFLKLLGAITKEYTKIFVPMLRDVGKARQSIRDVSERAIEESVQLEYALNEFVSALVPTNAALQQFLTGRHVSLHEEDRELAEDLQLANAQLIEGGKNALKAIQNIRSAHTALVSNKLNRVVRMLTAITIVLTIPTIIGTMYGMNVPLPLQESKYAFLFVISSMAVCVVAVLFLFKKNQWL